MTEVSRLDTSMAEPDSETLQLIATTAFGLEAVVSRELKALGYENVTVEDGRVLGAVWANTTLVELGE